MSHFTVLVIGDDPEGQLAPYQEYGGQDDFPEELLGFERDDEAYERWDDPTEGVEMVVIHDHSLIPHGVELGTHLRAGDEDIVAAFDDGTTVHVASAGELLVLPWSEIFKAPPTGDFLKDLGQPSAPKEMKRRMVPFRALYADLDTYMRDWHGHTRTNDGGEYGFWQNPNAKWDWYQLGGRWAGYYPVKQDVRESLARLGTDQETEEDRDLATQINIGSPGLMGARTQQPEGEVGVDACLKRHIDVESKQAASVESATSLWDENAEKIAAAQELLVNMRERGYEYNWDDLSAAERRAFILVRSGDDAPEEIARSIKILDEQWGEGVYELVLEYNKIQTDLYWNAGMDDADIRMTREGFIEERRKGSMATYAVLMDGEWHASGDMGWFGMSSNNDASWPSKFADLFDSLPDDTPLAVFDCHI